MKTILMIFLFVTLSLQLTAQEVPVYMDESATMQQRVESLQGRIEVEKDSMNQVFGRNGVMIAFSFIPDMLLNHYNHGSNYSTEYEMGLGFSSEYFIVKNNLYAGFGFNMFNKTEYDNKRLEGDKKRDLKESLLRPMAGHLNLGHVMRYYSSMIRTYVGAGWGRLGVTDTRTEPEGENKIKSSKPGLLFQVGAALHFKKYFFMNMRLLSMSNDVEYSIVGTDDTEYTQLKLNTIVFDAGFAF